jgi:hypothetical protein
MAAMQRVYRELVELREKGWLPWNWIVDEPREIEWPATYRDSDHYRRNIVEDLKHDPWVHQRHRVFIMSEKGTVRGVLRPIREK